MIIIMHCKNYFYHEFWALTDFNANKVNYLKLRNVSWVLEYTELKDLKG